ncbi:ABC-2 type transport system ATP-binding protein [Microterricola gilva]|uniref:ABC-2 type transport system ATP-binding protein n=1 Tax=Microterricola gilva TaxID=393267 RepID=A0A4Q8ARW9_9MICO|nr:ABC transporter ATP-binding protein [Microterricola gilva]RZU66923.1 ABC-2 type transport system ATP-binding protein [Microterricola gilva]
MSTVIETRGLQKHFGRVVALDGLDLSVASGEVHGFLGPNGAGKSTTIRVLLGLMRASGGSASVFGRDPWADAAALHARIAYVPGDVSLWPNLSGGEAIDLLTRLRGGDADKRAYASRRAALVEAFQFDPSKKARTYSKGNRQKVALIAALATPAELYIFDEPTSGLDPLMEAVFREQIGQRVGEGTSVLLSSHILSEVEHLCDRVSIIRAGRTVESGTLAELRHLTRTEVSFAAEGQGGSALSNAQLATIPGTHELLRDAARVRFTVDSDDMPAVLAALAALRVSGLTVNPPSLEELFLRHYGGQADAAAPAQPPSADATLSESRGEAGR